MWPRKQVIVRLVIKQVFNNKIIRKLDKKRLYYTSINIHSKLD